jgi:hypothetical protein
LTGPESDEIEVTLLGRGVGESVVVHVPGDDWIVVDSFEDSRRPVAMSYLDSIKVQPEQVKVLVITHFHKDHYEGIDKLHDRYRKARLMVTGALSGDRFADLFQDTVAQPVLGGLPGTIERANQREIAPSVGGLRYLSAGDEAHSVPGVVHARALSPTDAAIHQSNLELASRGLDRAGVTMLLRNDNRSSVVLSFQLHDGSALLLAADLVADHAAFGWQAIVSEPNNKSLDRADLVKVPHHGSFSAHDQAMWDHLVTDSAKLLVSPYSPRGLPLVSDVARLCELGDRLWQAGPSITEYVTDEFGNEREVKAKVGRITARRMFGDPEWRIVPEPPAFQACP